jgi:hypothetical protein
MIPRTASDASFQSTSSSQPGSRAAGCGGPQQQRAPVLVVTPAAAPSDDAATTTRAGTGTGHHRLNSGQGISVPLPTRPRPRFFPFFGPLRYVQRVTATAGHSGHHLSVAPAATTEDGAFCFIDRSID